MTITKQEIEELQTRITTLETQEAVEEQRKNDAFDRLKELGFEGGDYDTLKGKVEAFSNDVTVAYDDINTKVVKLEEFTGAVRAE